MNTRKPRPAKLTREQAAALLGQLVADGHAGLIVELADVIRKSQQQANAAGNATSDAAADCRIVWNLPPVRRFGDHFGHQNSPPTYGERRKSLPESDL